eukprot:TRINITY_DN47380_c0_g1_i1.p1 TRINITY_DN47380_c0_g1~~TRINITY_DN47380_c0_g1_i1.p1  ORF type:complete len:1005 (+),score=228.24 TRINITY_DN47380_c0_g1_i1:72-3086(+)
MHAGVGGGEDAQRQEAERLLGELHGHPAAAAAASARLTALQDDPAAPAACCRWIAAGGASSPLLFFCMQVWHRALVTGRWEQQPPELSLAVRAQLLAVLQGAHSVEPYVSHKTLDVLAALAAAEWPERWGDFMEWALHALRSAAAGDRAMAGRLIRSLLEVAGYEDDALGHARRAALRGALEQCAGQLLDALAAAAAAAGGGAEGDGARCAAAGALAAAVPCLPRGAVCTGVRDLLQHVCLDARSCLCSPVCTPLIQLCNELADTVTTPAGSAEALGVALAAACLCSLAAAAAQGCSDGEVSAALSKAVSELLRRHVQRLADGQLPPPAPALPALLQALGTWAVRVAQGGGRGGDEMQYFAEAWHRVAEHVETAAEQGRDLAPPSPLLTRLGPGLLDFLAAVLPCAADSADCSLLSAAAACEGAEAADADTWYAGPSGLLVLAAAKIAAAYPQEAIFGEDGGVVGRAFCAAARAFPASAGGCELVLQVYSALAPELMCCALHSRRREAVGRLVSALLGQQLLPHILLVRAGDAADPARIRVVRRAFGVAAALAPVVLRLAKAQLVDPAPLVAGLCAAAAAQLPCGGAAADAGRCLQEYAGPPLGAVLAATEQWPLLCAAVLAACPSPGPPGGSDFSGFTAAMLLAGAVGGAQSTPVPGVVSLLCNPPREQGLDCLSEALGAVGDTLSGAARAGVWEHIAPQLPALLQVVSGGSPAEGPAALRLIRTAVRHWRAQADASAATNEAARAVVAAVAAQRIPVAPCAELLELICRPPKSQHARAGCQAVLSLWPRAVASRDPWEAGAVLSLVHTIIDVHWELFWQGGHTQTQYERAAGEQSALWPQMFLCAAAPVVSPRDAMSEDPGVLHTVLQWLSRCDRDRGLFARALTEAQRQEVALGLLRLRCRRLALHSDALDRLLWQLCGGDAALTTPTAWRGAALSAAAQMLSGALLDPPATHPASQQQQAEELRTTAALAGAVAQPLPKAAFTEAIEAAARALRMRRSEV